MTFFFYMDQPKVNIWFAIVATCKSCELHIYPQRKFIFKRNARLLARVSMHVMKKVTYLAIFFFFGKTIHICIMGQ